MGRPYSPRKGGPLRFGWCTSTLRHRDTLEPGPDCEDAAGLNRHPCRTATVLAKRGVVPHGFCKGARLLLLPDLFQADRRRSQRHLSARRYLPCCLPHAGPGPGARSPSRPGPSPESPRRVCG